MTKSAQIEKRAALVAKVAAMSEEQKLSRIEHLCYQMPSSERNEDTEIEFSVIAEQVQPQLEATFKSKVASMTPSERIERREQLVNAAPSYAGDLEFCALIPYDANGENPRY